MKKRGKSVRMRLPKNFYTVAATEGTRAFEYLSGQRDPLNLTEDPKLLYIIDDENPQGGLLYVFKDHSSVVYKPTTQ